MSAAIVRWARASRTSLADLFGTDVAGTQPKIMYERRIQKCQAEHASLHRAYYRPQRVALTYFECQVYTVRITDRSA